MMSPDSAIFLEPEPDKDAEEDCCLGQLAEIDLILAPSQYDQSQSTLAISRWLHDIVVASFNQI